MVLHLDGSPSVASSSLSSASGFASTPGSLRLRSRSIIAVAAAGLEAARFAKEW